MHMLAVTQLAFCLLASLIVENVEEMKGSCNGSMKPAHKVNITRNILEIVKLASTTTRSRLYHNSL